MSTSHWSASLAAPHTIYPRRPPTWPSCIATTLFDSRLYFIARWWATTISAVTIEPARTTTPSRCTRDIERRQLVVPNLRRNKSLLVSFNIEVSWRTTWRTVRDQRFSRPSVRHFVAGESWTESIGPTRAAGATCALWNKVPMSSRRNGPAATRTARCGSPRATPRNRASREYTRGRLTVPLQIPNPLRQSHIRHELAHACVSAPAV